MERLRADAVIQAILGVARRPSAMTLTRYLGGCVRSQVEHLAEILWRFPRAQLRPVPLGAVLDLDSTVFERHGHQEGALKGHNPRKHGRPSHHPLLAILAEAKVVCNAWLRSGNTGTARGVEAFLAETLAKLPRGWRLCALRADSGFFVTEFLAALESRGLPYAIAVRMNPLVHWQLVGLTAWRSFGQGLEVAETPYQALRWPSPRWLVVVRERIAERPEARGFYLASFDGTEAAFRLICFLFHLVALFKRDATGNERPQLATLRARVLVVGAILGIQGPRPVLRLGLTGQTHAGFAALLDRIAVLVRPTVAPLDKWAATHGWSPPTPWRARKQPMFPRLQLRLN